jgi:hypothetical protein
VANQHGLQEHRLVGTRGCCRDAGVAVTLTQSVLIDLAKL